MVIIYVYIKLLFTNFELIELDLTHWKIYLIACHILVNNEASRLILVQRQLDEVKIKENEHDLTLSNSTESVQGKLSKRDSIGAYKNSANYNASFISKKIIAGCLY